MHRAIVGRAVVVRAIVPVPISRSSSEKWLKLVNVSFAKVIANLKQAYRFFWTTLYVTTAVNYTDSQVRRRYQRYHTTGTQYTHSSRAPVSQVSKSYIDIVHNVSDGS